MQDFLREIIKKAGAMTLEYRQRLGEISINYKTQSKKDVVTEADVAVEKYLVGEIKKRYPDHGIFGEESGVHEGNEFRWVIDPIDGTMSFCREQAYYSVSIAVEKAGQTVLGAVYAPVLDELFEAKLNGGATLNGQTIQVSAEKKLNESMLATGFACLRADQEHNNLPYFNRLIKQIVGIRRCGSAALDMAYVAAGRLEGYWEKNLNIYDVAAGMLLVTEAGGKCSDFNGTTTNYYQEITASNNHIHTELLKELTAVKNELKL